MLGAGAGGWPVVWREHVLPGPPGAGLNQVCLKALSLVPAGQAPRTVGSCGGGVWPEREHRHWAGPSVLGHRSRAAGVM